MQAPESSLVSAILSLVAMFLALAIVIQIIQELYKYLTCSKSRAYRQVLEDFIGPLANEILHQGALPGLHVRGPFQFSRLRPLRQVLPLREEEFSAALEHTAPVWIQKGLRALELEARTQDTVTRTPSPLWFAFLDQIGTVEKDGQGFHSAEQVALFLKAWGHRSSKRPDRDAAPIGTLIPPKRFDATRVLPSFRARFLGDIDAIAVRFPQLTANFSYAYQRRNMRHTFTIALLVALACNLPFDRLYQKSSALSATEAAALAERTLALYSQMQQDSLAPHDKTELRRIASGAAAATGTIASTPASSSPVNYIVDWSTLRALWGAGAWSMLRYLFGCLITALLLSFGAPIWNDIASALLRVQKGIGKQPAPIGEDASGG